MTDRRWVAMWWTRATDGGPICACPLASGCPQPGDHPIETVCPGGRPLAARAVGSACGANHVAPFVPCHRVIAGNGSLGGYGYGLPIKRWLLDHEARSRPVADAQARSVAAQ